MKSDLRQAAIKRLLVYVLVCSLPLYGQNSEVGKFRIKGNSSFHGQAQTQQIAPDLPNFTDPKELECGYASYPSCFPGSPALTTPYSAPTLLLTLSSGGGTWDTYPGGSPTTAPACATLSYTNNGAGLQNAFTTQDHCRTSSAIGIRLAVPVLSTDSGTGCDTGVYCSPVGFVIPQTSTTYGIIPLVSISAAEASLLAMAMPIGTGGVQENVPTSTSIRIDNPTNDGNNLSFQIGSIVTNITVNGSAASGITFPYSLANGTTFNTLSALIAAYNYQQYMPHLECSDTNCTPLAFCSPSTTPCGNSANIGADHWELDDFNVSLPAGSLSNANLIDGGTVLAAFFVSPTETEFGEHNHLRRIWAHGDWYCSDLSCGSNKVAAGITMGAQYYFSVGDSYISAGISPGNESHCGGVDGTQGYIFNTVCSGLSSGWFSGGFGQAPATPTYTPATDIEFGPPWVVNTFPYTWLGINCHNYQDGKGNNGGPGCGSVPTDNYAWGGAGDNFAQSVPTAVTAVSPTGSGASFALVITSALNPGVGNNAVTLAGFSPAAYNQNYPVTASSGSSFTLVPSQSITAATVSGSTMTLTSGLSPGTGSGNPIFITGLTPSACNGAFNPTASNAGSFNVSVTGSCTGTVAVAPSATAYLQATPSVGSSPTAQLTGPVCPYVSASNIVCVDVDTTGEVVTIHGGTYPAGMPPFHDSHSSWGVAHKPVHINNDATTYNIALMGSGTCSAWPAVTGCPTTLTLQAPVAECVGSGCSNVAFVFHSPSIVKKNGQENKSQLRVIKMMRIQGGDNSGAQNGVSEEDDPRNVSGGAHGINYGASNSNVTILDTVMDGFCTGREHDARSAGAGGDGGGVSQSNRWFRYWNILEFNNSATNPGCNTDSFGSFIDTAIQTWTGNITAAAGFNTFTATFSQDAGAPLESDSYTSFSVSGTSATVPTPGGNTFVVGETVNMVGTGTCMDNNPGIVGAGLTSTSVPIAGLNNCSGNPTGTGSIQGPVGFQTFGMQIGDPVYVTGCGQSADNMPSAPGYTNIAQQTGTSFAPYATGGLTPYNFVTGWVTSNTTIVYPWSGGVNDSSGTCTLINSTGNPQTLDIAHNTMITDAQNPIGGGPSKSHGASIQFKNIYRDSIFLTGTASGNTQFPAGSGGLWNSAVNSPNEGTSPELFNYDFASSTLCGLVFPGRSNSGTGGPSPYTFLATGTTYLTANPNYPCMVPYSFPANTCAVGFNGTGSWAFGTCSGNVVPQTSPFGAVDYHAFALNSGSPFHNAASDGLDVGAIITGTAFNGTSIDAGAVAKQFSCSWVPQSNCPTPGPFPID